MLVNREGGGFAKAVALLSDERFKAVEKPIIRCKSEDSEEQRRSRRRTAASRVAESLYR
jgi:hypothetical protein